MVNVKVNPILDDLVRIFPDDKRSKYLRLDMNENPEGLPKDFVADICNKITPEFLATYPEQSDMLAALSQYHQLPADQFCLTDGSEMAIKHIFEVFAIPASNVVTVSPSFAMYGVFCSMFGVEHRAVSIEADFKFPLDSFIDAIDEATSIVVILSPNNPVGGVLPKASIECIVKKAAECNATVIIDEAYHYFCKISCLDLVDMYQNVIVLRTFSKLFSMAACRLGYAVTNSELALLLNKVRPTFETNSLALLFGVEILKRPEIIKNLIDIENEGRKYLIKALCKAGYNPWYDGGNYILIKTNQKPDIIEKKLAEQKILIKTYSNQSLLKDYIRVSTGSKKMMKQFIKAFFGMD